MKKRDKKLVRRILRGIADLVDAAQCLRHDVATGVDEVGRPSPVRPEDYAPMAATLVVDAAACRLAKEVYAAVLKDTESFEVGRVGVHLAYLMGAIVRHEPKGFIVERTGDQRPLVALLQAHFGADHRVWRYVDFEADYIAAPTAIKE